MKISFSTSVIQRGKTGVAQYVFALLRALLPHARQHEFHLFVLEEDRPFFRHVPRLDLESPALARLAFLGKFGLPV